MPFLTPDGRKKILDEVVSAMLFAEAAKAEGVDKEPAVKTRLDYAQTEYLVESTLRRQLAKNPVLSEQELQPTTRNTNPSFTPPEEIKAPPHSRKDRSSGEQDPR